VSPPAYLPVLRLGSTIAGIGICELRSEGVDAFVLDQIPYEPDIERLLKVLRLPPESRHAARLRELAAEAQALARPKALCREAYVEARGEDHVVIAGIRLTSHILRVNLEGAYRTFPFVATCGRELAAWAEPIDDILESYWAAAIMEQAMRTATHALDAHLEAHFVLGRTATMNPGSLEDWPLPQQGQLFALLGNPCEAIGVELTESYLMVPVKSVSGLRFPAETSFENCQLCPRPQCPGRRAPYDKDLYDQRYR